jgi:hypothetical protein
MRFLIGSVLFLLVILVTIAGWSMLLFLITHVRIV